MLRFPYLINVGQPYDIWVIKDLITLRLKNWQNTSAGKKTGKKVVGKKAAGKKAAEMKEGTTRQSRSDPVD
jgi:hypothetical protein